MPTVQLPPAPSAPMATQPILPTLFGEGYGAYGARPTAFVFSYLLNVAIIAVMAWSTHWVVQNRQAIKQQVINIVTDVSPYVLPPSKTEAGGGGGGGDRDKLAASKGSPPKFAREQFTPPTVVVRNDAPKLAIEPTVVGPPELKLQQSSVIGDPFSTILGPPSNGTGSGGGIGSGSGGGVGSGRGPGVGPGAGGGIGGGYYKVGGGVSAPRPLYSPDPEYSEEARKAKYQGTVTLWMIVGPDGHTHQIRVIRTLGLGLDEKAIEAVKEWRFEPAHRNGQAVAVEINVEVSFRLY